MALADRNEPVPDSDATSENLCLVCTDRATGCHYSVMTCEGCKGFFKRTVQKQLLYNCKNGDQRCHINKQNRNHCQFCRFQKCLQVGMQTNAVREDRMPGGRPKHKRLKTKTGHGTQMEEPTSSSQEQSPVDAGQFNPGIDWQGVLKPLIDAKPELIPVTDGISPDTCSLNEMMKIGYTELNMIIQWAKRLPGFSSISLEDRISLLKASFMDIVVLRVSYRSLDLPPQTLKYSSTLILHEDQAVKLGWQPDLIKGNIEYVKRLRDLHLDPQEYAVMCVLVLFFPDAAELKNRQLIMEMQSHYLECLRLYQLDQYGAEEGLKRYGKFLLRLPTLRIVSAKAMENFFSLRLDGKIEITALVQEMLEMKV